MKKGKDLATEFEHLYLVHQNVPGKRISQISHASHILFIPLQGEINITVNEKEFVLGPGHMLYLPASTSHSFDSSSLSGERLIAMIDPRLQSARNIKTRNPVILPLSQLIKEILFYLLLHSKTSNSKSLVTVLVETLIESLNGHGKGEGSTTEHLSGKIRDDRIRRIVNFMQDHLGDKISIDRIATHAGLSSRNLNRLMLQEIGMTPKQFLIAARIEKAQELLLKPGGSVTQVAFEVGYNSLSQFIAAFRSQTGQLPSEVSRIGRKPKI